MFESAGPSYREDYMSGYGYSKSVKSQPFPTGVHSSDKAFKWTMWVKNFTLALERANVRTQRDRAIELSLAAGEEIQTIIMTENLLPDEAEVGPDFLYFDYIAEGIMTAFERMTDTNVNAREFYHMKQKEGESVSEYALRVRIAAQKLNLSHDALVTSVFIGGLLDRSVQRWANAFHLDMEETIQVAIRSENDPAFRANMAVTSREGTAPLAVAAIEASSDRSNYRRKNEKKAKKRSRSPEEKRRKQSDDAGEKKRCRSCGHSSHHDRPCPATNAQCYKCKKTGHFGAVCKEVEVRVVNTSACRDEVSKNVFPRRDEY
jgi:hypothetical protein